MWGLWVKPKRAACSIGRRVQSAQLTSCDSPPAYKPNHTADLVRLLSNPQLPITLPPPRGNASGAREKAARWPPGPPPRAP